MPDTSSRYIKFIVYLVVIVLVNIAGSTLFFRLDLTENRIYSLSEASKRVVGSITEPLTIKVFFTENLPAPHNATEQYLRDLLSEYAANSNRYFNYTFYNVSTEAGDISETASENQKLAQNYGINPIQIQIVEKDEIQFRKAYMGLVMIHGDIIEKVPTITTTDGLEYKLTMAIQRLNNKVSALLSLTDKIRVRVFMSSSLLPVAPLMGLEDLDKLPGEIEKAVEELNGKNYGKLEYEFSDPTKTPALVSEAEKYDLMNVKWPAVAEQNIAAGSGIIGMALAYGEKAVNIPLIQVFRLPLIGTQYRALEPGQISELIDGSLAGLIGIHEDLGVLAGKGSLDIGGGGGNPMMQQSQDNITGLRALLENSYSIRNVALDGVIPVDVQCLLIARPTEKFSDYELFQIDQFLMRGGNLALIVDAFREFIPPQNMGVPGPMHIPLDTGLEKLLDHWGIRIEKSLVMDENCYKQRLPQDMGGGERAIYFAPMIQNRFINKDLSVMKNIKGLIAVNISPLTTDEKKLADNGLTSRLLFSSSDRSWEMKDRINLNPDMIQPPVSDDEFKSFPLAYVLEGSFPSYFAGKPIPEKPEEKKEEATPDGQTAEDGKKDPSQEAAGKQKTAEPPAAPDIQETGLVLTKSKPAKIFVMAASEMLKDTVLEAEGRSPNAIYVMNMLDYLNDREDVAVMRSKEQQFNPLAETGPGLKTAVKSMNIAGLPVVVIAFGLIVWSRRASRKRKLKMMFQKQELSS